MDAPLEYNEGAQMFISESGLYSLIMRSKMAEAESFQRWVTKDMLPTIRRTGQYIAPQTSTISKKHTELEILEIDERIKSCKRRCVEEDDHINACTRRCVEEGLASLQRCGLSVDDRDRTIENTA